MERAFPAVAGRHAPAHLLGRIGEVSDIVDAVPYLQKATFVTPTPTEGATQHFGPMESLAALG